MASVPPFDPAHGEPAYLSVRMADHLEARINAGDIPLGARLPGERDLAAEYQVAVGTARRAVEELRQRGLAVTLHTGHGGQPRGLPFPAGLWLHAPLYIWGDAAGTWPRGGHRSCPVYDDPYHWDNVAEPGRSVDLVNRWVAAVGDDDVVWAELDREHDVLTRKYEAFLTGKRELVVAGLKERGRDQDAEKFAGYDPPKAEAWLVNWEKKRLTADLERGKTLARLWREGLEESNRRFPSDPGPGQRPPAR